MSNFNNLFNKKTYYYNFKTIFIFKKNKHSAIREYLCNFNRKTFLKNTFY